MFLYYVGDNLSPTFFHRSAEFVDLNQVKTASYILSSNRRRFQSAKFFLQLHYVSHVFFCGTSAAEESKKYFSDKKIRNYRSGVVVDERAPPSQPHNNIIRNTNYFWLIRPLRFSETVSTNAVFSCPAVTRKFIIAVRIL